MLFDVEKIAELTGVSKVTIYRKMKLNEISKFIIIKNGKSFLTEEGLEVLKDMLNISDTQEIPLDKPQEATENSLSIEYINTLKEQIEHLRRQTDTKDEQLRVNNEHIADLIKTNQHSQMMLQEKDGKLQELLLLEQGKDTENKNNEDKQEVSNVVNEEKPKGFFKRIFKR